MLLNCLPRRVESDRRPSSATGSGIGTTVNRALPSSVSKRSPGGRLGPPNWNESPWAASFSIPPYCGMTSAISARIAGVSPKVSRSASSGRARAASSPSTSHSGRASSIRGPSISGLKITRRSVLVSVTPPGTS